MDAYSVADVSKMLNVNEETVRRWIRNGKLKAIRAVGRGGNTVFLEDIVDFANKPPRAYLIFLEEWLNKNEISYKRINDFEYSDRTKALGAVTLGAGAATAASAAATALAPATLSVAGISAMTTAVAGPVGIGVAGIAYGAAKLAKRKNQRTYSIRLMGADAEKIDEIQGVLLAEEPKENPVRAGNEDLLSGVHPKTQEAIKVKPAKNNEKKEDIEADVAASTSVLDKIVQAKQMLDTGIITQEEFSAIKARLIAKI